MAQYFSTTILDRKKDGNLIGNIEQQLQESIDHNTDKGYTLESVTAITKEGTTEGLIVVYKVHR